MKILLEQPTSEETAYAVEDYPYGFTQRTTKRFWVETTKRGQRFVGQTLNPKTKLWNKPKKSTYSTILLIGLDEKNHITYTSFSASCSSQKECVAWGEKYGSYLSVHQKQELQHMRGMLEVYDKVEYTVRTRQFKNCFTGEISSSIPMMEIDDWKECDEQGELIDKEAEEKEQKEQNRKINRLAVLNARTTAKSSIPEAVETFKRC